MYYEKQIYDPALHIPALLDIFRRGEHIACFCAQYLISRRTFFDWLEKHPEFNEAYEIAQELSRHHWEHMAWDNIVCLEKEKFNSQIWHLIMRNRFGYAGERLVALKGWTKKKTPQQKIKMVGEHLENGSITFSEAVSLLNAVNIESIIVERAEVLPRLEALEAKANEIQR